MIRLWLLARALQAGAFIANLFRRRFDNPAAFWHSQDMPITYRSRDSFARETRVRSHCTHGTCDECGREGRVWQYGTHRDGLNTRPDFVRGWFCSVDCARSYHGDRAI